MSTFLIAVVFTLGVSFVCSLLEAMFLSTTTAEIEALKQQHPRRGKLFEDSRNRTEETISSILTLNTIANTLGSVLVGGIAIKLFGEAVLGVVSALMTLAILVLSEVIPKNLGVAYRRGLQKHAAYPLHWMRRLLRPVTHVCSLLVRAIIRSKPDDADSDREIVLLAEKGAREGKLTSGERDLIHNALSLSSTRVGELLTPRSVVVTLEEDQTAAGVLAEHPSIRFSRMPVHDGTLDEITGIARRRDILQSVASGQGGRTIRELKHPVTFIPEMATAASALQTLLAANQQLAAVIDEYGGFVGVIAIEDIVEHLIGREIYEKDDLAVDMRALARRRQKLRGNARATTMAGAGGRP